MASKSEQFKVTFQQNPKVDQDGQKENVGEAESPSNLASPVRSASGALGLRAVVSGMMSITKMTKRKKGENFIQKSQPDDF